MDGIYRQYYQINLFPHVCWPICAHWHSSRIIAIFYLDISCTCGVVVDYRVIEIGVRAGLRIELAIARFSP